MSLEHNFAVARDCGHLTYTTTEPTLTVRPTLRFIPPNMRREVVRISRAPYITDADLTIYVGDAMDVLADLPDGSVDCVVTSPPYW